MSKLKKGDIAIVVDVDSNAGIPHNCKGAFIKIKERLQDRSCNGVKGLIVNGSGKDTLFFSTKEIKKATKLVQLLYSEES